MERGRDDTVERVRDATDIVQLIGQYVNLKRAGRSFKGLCPFHNEKTPSFMVSPERQMYHCFGCHKGGDAFSFLMEHDGVSFVEALRSLGERAGIAVETRRPGDGGHDALYDAAERAARFFTARLEQPEAEPVRRYIRARGLGAAIVERFRLGAAANAWEDLARELRQEGVLEAALLSLGLVARRAQAGGFYDVFRNRLMIPVVSLSGRVVGFGARVLPEGEGGTRGPKYLNSSDSPIYRKGHLLYGLAEARAAIRRRDAVVVTEGYLDFLSLYQAGIEHVVAACGTAFTPQQAALLQRYTRRAYILGDGDAAGRRAAVRAAGLLLEYGFLVYLVELPGGYDPDSFVREHGAAALETRVREAPSYIAFMKLLVDRRAGDLAVKERALRHLLDDLARVQDPVLRELYGAELARTFGVSDAALGAALEERRGRPAAARAAAPASPAAVPTGAVAEAQRGLLRLGLLGSDWAGRLVTTLDPVDFDAGPARRLFEALARTDATGGGWFDRLEDEQDRAFATELALADGPAGDPERLFQDYAAALKGARLEAAEVALRQRLVEAEGRGDEAETARLLAEQRRMAQDRSEWKRRATWS